MVKTLTLYKRIIEELGLRQLDVYRIRDENGAPKDIIRLFDPATNKVFTIDLGKIRESVTPVEFIETLVKEAKKIEINLPERKINELLNSFKGKE